MESKVKLSERLSAVASMVSKGGCVADVGCDHGFVSIYLMQSHISDRVIAMDVNRGPLERAAQHVTDYGLGDYIELRLSDGLERVTSEDNVQTAVIAGMGGKLMEKIIAQAAERGLYVPELVLAPQSDRASLRRFLRKKEYTIVEETMICEDGKFYPIMKLRYKAPRLPGICYESEYADAFGPCLLSEKHPVLGQYLRNEIMKFERIYNEMEQRGRIDVQIAEKLDFLKAAEIHFQRG